MGGHGGSSGYKKGNGANGGNIGASPTAAFSAVDTAKQAAQAVDINSLPGQNGNPWPPNANSEHLPYSEGGGLAIWTMLGGGVANGGVSSQTAKDMDAAVKHYTGSGYSAMRDAFEAGDTTSHAGKEAQSVQSFIEKSIETGNGWTGGATYRGIGSLPHSTWSAYTSLKPGDSIDCNLSAPASWSTERSTAEHFGGSHNHITFVHLAPTQKGVSVDHISTCEGEKEVLVSGKAKFRVVAVSPTKKLGYSGSQTYIYVEDAD